ncbi:permease [Anaeromicropila populeti]|uniref:Predicted permease n=1 Tax=Anaeromicropila populeti TaxID=37658 RepID=A0A1I6HIE4_9FIRM|nr:permease [Anaeromicropila populeti]SFR54168.1 Predicted permease [Anaeromicropila populeti]
MFTYVLYGTMSVLLIASWSKDKKKTKMALKKAWKSFENILPQLFTVLLIIGMMLSVLDKEMISSLLGSESGVLGMALAAIIGSITLIPGFVAFPLAASLLKAGAGYGQITMFITTLMMVGIVTMPVEIQYFGRSTTIKRNLFAFFYAVVISVLLGGIIYK